MGTPGKLGCLRNFMILFCFASTSKVPFPFCTCFNYTFISFSIFFFSLRSQSNYGVEELEFRSFHVVQWVKDSTSIHEDVGLIPGLAQ